MSPQLPSYQFFPAEAQEKDFSKGDQVVPKQEPVLGAERNSFLISNYLLYKQLQEELTAYSISFAFKVSGGKTAQSVQNQHLLRSEPVESREDTLRW